MKWPTYPRHVETEPLTLTDARALVGGVCHEDGSPFTEEEILADSSISKVVRVRGIVTGKMKPADEGSNMTGIPFFVVRASRDR